MNEEKLDLSSFERAIESFKKALDELRKDDTNEYVRDACIQRFEYCYELSHKIIKRHLTNTTANPSDIEELSFQNLIREAYKKGILLNSWDIWHKYRENRNKTSHGYDKNIAIDIVQKIPSFLGELEHLLEKLQKYYEN